MAPKVVNKPIAKAQATAEAVTPLASASAVDEWRRAQALSPSYQARQRRAQAMAVATACLIASGLPRRIVAKIMCRYI